MPRCFMAKKLKYPYEQWKQEQDQLQRSTSEVSGSRSPSPMEEDDDEHLERSKELASTVAASSTEAAAHTGHDLSHNGGKWCFFAH